MDNYDNHAGAPATSRRAQNHARRMQAQANPVLSFADDESGASATVNILGTVAAGAVGALLVFVFTNMIEATNASQRGGCDTWYATFTTEIDACKERLGNKMMIWNIGAFLLVLGGAGLGAYIGHKTGGNGAGLTFGIIVLGAVGTWLVFMFNGMVEAENGKTYSSCATWYTGSTPEINACKDRASQKAMGWNIVSLILVLGCCGLGAVAGHFGQNAARRRFGGGGRRSGGYRGHRGRPSYR